MGGVLSREATSGLNAFLRQAQEIIAQMQAAGEHAAGQDVTSTSEDGEVQITPPSGSAARSFPATAARACSCPAKSFSEDHIPHPVANLNSPVLTHVGQQVGGVGRLGARLVTYSIA